MVSAAFPVERARAKSERQNMNWFKSSKTRQGASLGLAAILAVAAIYLASLAAVSGADTNAPAAKPAKPAPAAKPAKPAQKKKLTGAELYTINCNRCHPERYATEFTSAQWKTLMTHMRVRANLPASQAKLILKYLQEDSGN
jgi:mono/diheme cytochrome c family protein